MYLPILFSFCAFSYAANYYTPNTLACSGGATITSDVSEYDYDILSIDTDYDFDSQECLELPTKPHILFLGSITVITSQTTIYISNYTTGNIFQENCNITFSGENIDYLGFGAHKYYEFRENSSVIYSGEMNVYTPLNISNSSTLIVHGSVSVISNPIYISKNTSLVISDQFAVVLGGSLTLDDFSTINTGGNFSIYSTSTADILGYSTINSDSCFTIVNSICFIESSYINVESTFYLDNDGNCSIYNSSVIGNGSLAINTGGNLTITHFTTFFSNNYFYIGEGVLLINDNSNVIINDYFVCSEGSLLTISNSCNLDICGFFQNTGTVIINNSFVNVNQFNTYDLYSTNKKIGIISSTGSNFYVNNGVVNIYACNYTDINDYFYSLKLGIQVSNGAYLELSENSEIQLYSSNDIEYDFGSFINGKLNLSGNSFISTPIFD
ncbi:hypothetical protein QTN25_010554 [Entamoeba marina]